MDYSFLLALTIILASTKILGLVSKKINMPQVVGALIAGIVIGPSALNIVQDDMFINQVAEIGVIILMFQAGIGTDFNELKKTGVASFVIALIGVIVPMAGGALTYCSFYGFDFSNNEILIRAIFIGVILMATSVSITVETLKELGKLKGRMGTAILGAAIIDDIIGIIVLTLITSMKGGTEQANPVESIIKIALFFVFVAVCALAVRLISKIPEKYYKHKHRVAIFGLAVAFIMSYCAEHFFGVADITGAYFAGLILCNYSPRDYIDSKVNTVSYMFFAPAFFASIGIKTVISGMDSTILSFSIVLLIVAILSKIVGCGLGAKICRFSNKESLAIGIGMVSRGEVALIVAQKGSEIGLIDEALFPAVVIVVIVTTIITPILLKLILTEKKKNTKPSKNIKENVILDAQTN